MSNVLKTYGFAALMCLVCSLFLTAAATGLKERQRQNVVVDRQRNILMAVGLVEDDQPVSAQEIQALFNNQVKSIWVNAQGETVAPELRGEQDLPIYLYAPNGDLDAYVVPIDTAGLWGKIHGYLAIDKDGATVRGFTVYKHQETPGLGGGGRSNEPGFVRTSKGKKSSIRPDNLSPLASPKAKWLSGYRTRSRSTMWMVSAAQPLPASF